MRMRMNKVVALAMVALSGAAGAQRTPHPQAEAQALELAKKAIAIPSVQGRGNRTSEVAALFRDALIANGFAPDKVVVTPVDDTAYLIATWPGSDPALKPVVISGHMDVVEAKASDWKRDPFTPVVRSEEHTSELQSLRHLVCRI